MPVGLRQAPLKFAVAVTDEGWFVRRGVDAYRRRVSSLGRVDHFFIPPCIFFCRCPSDLGARRVGICLRMVVGAREVSEFLRHPRVLCRLCTRALLSRDVVLNRPRGLQVCPRRTVVPWITNALVGLFTVSKQRRLAPE